MLSESEHFASKCLVRVNIYTPTKEKHPSRNKQS